MRREVQVVVVVITLAAGLLAAADASPVVRSPFMTAALLIAPGLAASYRMGPMSIEMRALISVSTSIALVTLVAVGMLVAGAWSTGAAFVVVAAVTLGFSLYPAARAPETP